MKRLVLSLLASLVLACAGTEVTNPDAHGGAGGSGGTNGGTGGTGGMGGTGGTGGTGGSGGMGGSGGAGEGPVVPAPAAIDFGATCPGGLARAWLDLENQGDGAVLVELDAFDVLAFSPVELSIEPRGSARVAVVYPAPLDAASGVHDGIATATWNDGWSSAQIPWNVDVVDAQAGRSTLLCGAEGPCETLAFAGAPGATIELPIAVVNDGCGPVTVVGSEATGATFDLDGDTLPLELAPGARWEATLRLTLDANAQGTFRMLTDEDAAPAAIPFTATVQGDQSTR